jgi:hypothetical protein
MIATQNFGLRGYYISSPLHVSRCALAPKWHTRQPAWALTIFDNPPPVRPVPTWWVAASIEDYPMRNDHVAPNLRPRPGPRFDHGPGGVRELSDPNVDLALAPGTIPGPEDCESAPVPAWRAGAPGVLNQEC